MEKRFRRQAIALCAVAAAMAAAGADFPAPVNGTVTITAAGTYDGDFPSGTVSLEVNVATSETVVVSGDHPSFAGTVTVSGGTLKAASQYALGGEDATVSVESGARLWIAFAQPSGTGETSVLWKPKTIIAGSGVAAGGGALKVCFSGSANCDKGVRWLELSDDATVDLSVDSGCTRWGAENLYPRGHTLTRANSGVYFVMRGAATGPGHYVNNAGTMLLQYLAFTSDCTTNNTSFTANAGTLSLWSNTQQNSVPGPVYLRGGAFGYSNSGTSSPSYAWVSGPITYYSGSGITGTGAKKLSHFDGGLVNASTTASFPVVCTGTNWIASLSSTGGKGFKFSNDGSGGQGNCDFPHLFSAPTGRGIASITLPAAVTGLKYLGPAPIVIEGPGYGATAFADFDYATMSITTGVVLSAGCDYDSSTKVYLLGPTGDPQKYECTYELTSDGRAAGPFTKRGAGRLALYGQQGWGVATRVEGGTLRAVDSGSVPQDIGLAVESGATLELQYGDLSVSSLSGLGTITSSSADRGNVTLASGGTIGVVADDIVSGGKGPMTLAVGKLTLAGPTTVVVADPEAILHHEGKITILTAADGIELASGASLQLDPACGLDEKWHVRVFGQTIALSPIKATTLIIR